MRRCGSRWGLRLVIELTRYKNTMIRWMIVIFLTLVFISALTPWLNKLGFGKLPGDLRFKLFGKERYIPLTTTIVLSLIASVVSHLF